MWKLTERDSLKLNTTTTTTTTFLSGRNVKIKCQYCNGTHTFTQRKQSLLERASMVQLRDKLIDGNDDANAISYKQCAQRVPHVSGDSSAKTEPSIVWWINHSWANWMLTRPTCGGTSEDKTPKRFLFGLHK